MAKSKFLTAAQEFIMNMIFPGFVAMGADEFKTWLQKVYDENPELIKNLLISLYPFVDVYLERFVAKTKTKLDDKVVAQLKSTLEEFASENEIELPNLDEGMEGD